MEEYSTEQKWTIAVLVLAGLWAWGYIFSGAAHDEVRLESLERATSTERATQYVGSNGEIEWGSKSKAWYTCQVEAERRLRSPRSARHPPFNRDVEDLVKHDPPNAYVLAAWVYAKNAMGVELRNGYVCSVEFTGWESWDLLFFDWRD